MQSYGNYQLDREIATGQGTVVYRARPPGAAGPPTCAVKVFSPNLLTLLDAAAKEELDALYAGLTRAALQRVEIQKKAAAASPCVAPVLDHGQDGTSVWFATPLYPQSLENALSTRVQFGGAALTHLLLSITRGALAIKQTCGRAHGNLKPTNVFVGSTGKVESGAVVVSDPVHGGAAEADTLELADLKAIGQLLYQLVRRKAVTDWESLILPLEVTAEWKAAFGKNAPQWIALCNRLLHHELALADLDLAKLEQEILKLVPKGVGSRVALPLGLAALVVLLGAGGFFGWKLTRKGTLVLNCRLPGATLAIKDATGRATEPAITTTGQPVTRRLKAGSYSVEARYEFKQPPARTNVLSATNIVFTAEVRPQFPTNLDFVFLHGTVAVTSSNVAGATIELTETNGVSLPTAQNWGPSPARFELLPPGRYKFQVSDTRQEHWPAATNLILEPGADLNVAVTLQRKRENEGYVFFKRLSTLPFTVVFGGESNVAPCGFSALAGPRVFTVRVHPWPDLRITNIVVPNETITNLLDLPFAQLSFDTTPTNAEVWASSVNFSNLVGRTPISSRPWPTGEFTFRIWADGYKTNEFRQTLVAGQAFRWATNLVPMGGVVTLRTDLEGTRVSLVTNAALSWLVGTNATNVILPLGTNLLVAEYREGLLGPLLPVTNSVPSALRQTNQLSFQIARATVRVRTGTEAAAIELGGKALPGLSIEGLVRTNEPLAGRITKLHFDTVNFNVPALANGETWTLSTNLIPTLYSLAIAVDPPDAAIEDDRGQQVRTNLLQLQRPWGSYRFIARRPPLDPVTNVVATVEGRIPTQQLRLAHAKVRLRTTQSGLKVFLDSTNADTGLTTPLVDFVLRPGPHQFYFAPAYNLGLATNWPAAPQPFADGTLTETNLPFQFQPDVWTNSVQMALVRVAKGSSIYYVGRLEVTREQYQAVAGAAPVVADLSYLTPQHPVTLVPFQKAAEFCALLSQRDRASLDKDQFQGWAYEIPTQTQWKEFAVADGNSLVNAVFKPPETLQPATETPRSASNSFGLFDLYGNAEEWCRDADGNVITVGGACDRLRPKTQVGADRLISEVLTNSPEGKDFVEKGGAYIGFRVVLQRKP
ncbi:MAG: SUMF1/EgtB/PvdO family nonheme iron enzyme [Verrucomicrobia bacterium]|nr:SUMF1/EgtB/PvdO family nonheme iron enzyme [Verrucomicrobiota bacterium]